MEYLTLAEIRSREPEIRSAFDRLMTTRTFASRGYARQWRFLDRCLDCTLGGATREFAATPAQLAQYKFEVEDRLRRYYLRIGQPVAYVFRLMHRRDALRDGLVVEAAYPDTGGYYLLVRDRRDVGADVLESIAETRDYVEKTVAACIDAEFDAYQALPEIDEGRLLKWFAPRAAAYRDLIHTLARLAQRGWVLTNPHNPSTKRLLSIDAREVRGDTAIVRTTEYWYLRWWSTVEGKYRYPYRETNRQIYVLVRQGREWFVDENIRPAPRSSTPHRQK